MDTFLKQLSLLAYVFSSEGFGPRSACGWYTPGLMTALQLGDLGIFVAYMGIPLVIFGTFMQHQRLKLAWVSVLFVAFIALCGATHFIKYVTWYVPVYYLEAVITFLTAVVSLVTMIILIPVSRILARIKLPSEWQREVATRTDVERSMAREVATLREENLELMERLRRHQNERSGVK